MKAFILAALAVVILIIIVACNRMADKQDQDIVYVQIDNPVRNSEYSEYTEPRSCHTPTWYHRSHRDFNHHRLRHQLHSSHFGHQRRRRHI